MLTCFLLGLFTGASGTGFLALVMHRRACEAQHDLRLLKHAIRTLPLAPERLQGPN